MSPGVTEEAGQTARSAIDVFRAQPGLLFLTLVNVAFLIFVYMVATMTISAYNQQQAQLHDRYQHTLDLVDRCIMAAFKTTAEVVTNYNDKDLPPRPN